jgi:glycosyltransferase involved in cell wall biosynthesis
MKICFLDNSKIQYNSKDIYSNKIRGAENILINLVNEFTKLKHDVIVYNNTPKNEKIDNAYWFNLNSINKSNTFDLVITNNDINLLNLVNSDNKIAISHSIQTIEKFIRKKQFFSYIKNKPKIVLLSKYHQQKRNIFLKLFGSFQTDWAVDDVFLDYDIDITKVSKNAIFTSNLDRNGDLLIKLWKEQIFKNNKQNKLFITPKKINLTKYNIFNRKFGTKTELAHDLNNSRVMLIPGHKAELFCIAAEEAREMCLPIITLGIGCLNERVIHEKTGFVSKNIKEFINYTNILFNDDNLLLELRKNLLKLRGSKKWSIISKNFLKYALN